MVVLQTYCQDKSCFRTQCQKKHITTIAIIATLPSQDSLFALVPLVSLFHIKIATFTGFISFSTFTSVLTFLWPMSQCYNSYSVSLQLKKANTHVRPLLPFKEQMSNVMIRHCLIDNQQPALLLYIVEQTETEYPGFN